ncbi:hypothetical protein PR048_001726 [Dryococelus australis]|uniref:PiggyBac transposable element-derived protein domain-containing protein n=1 Tax=Dryococelus australis TaxID=614101 RepID=A0ABQ9II95_9NEOP|nr:hypothetical protein PR048_001726 [Dryococelus australis]
MWLQQDDSPSLFAIAVRGHLNVHSLNRKPQHEKDPAPKEFGDIETRDIICWKTFPVHEGKIDNTAVISVFGNASLYSQIPSIGLRLGADIGPRSSVSVAEAATYKKRAESQTADLHFQLLQLTSRCASARCQAPCSRIREVPPWLLDRLPFENQAVSSSENQAGSRHQIFHQETVKVTVKPKKKVYIVIQSNPVIVKMKMKNLRVFHWVMRVNYGRERDCGSITFVELSALLGLLYLADLDINDRDSRKLTDNLAPIRNILEQFVTQCVANYQEGEYATVGEILEAFRGRCKFRQHTANKSAKYRIKVYALVDSRTFYTINLEIYPGRQPEGPHKYDNNASGVVKRTAAPVVNTSRHITVDSYFTSMSLARDLLTQNSTIVGTLRENKKGIPPSFVNTKKGHNEAACLLFHLQPEAVRQWSTAATHWPLMVLGRLAYSWLRKVQPLMGRLNCATWKLSEQWLRCGELHTRVKRHHIGQHAYVSASRRLNDFGNLVCELRVFSVFMVTSNFSKVLLKFCFQNVPPPHAKKKLPRGAAVEQWLGRSPPNMAIRSSIPGGLTPGISHVGIVLDDVVCRRTLSRHSLLPALRFQHRSIPGSHFMSSPVMMGVPFEEVVGTVGAMAAEVDGGAAAADAQSDEVDNTVPNTGVNEPATFGSIVYSSCLHELRRNVFHDCHCQTRLPNWNMAAYIQAHRLDTCDSNTTIDFFSNGTNSAIDFFGVTPIAQSTSADTPEYGRDQSKFITTTNTRGGERSVDTAARAREEAVDDSKADGVAAGPGIGGSSLSRCETCIDKAGQPIASQASRYTLKDLRAVWEEVPGCK